jgi:hypothetical protein|tara:strand:+ start:1445 stop:1645 length:201 start_codon:yes stop_codon:yes gene_type:complete
VSLGQDHILIRLHKFITEQLNDGADHLASGGARNFDEYSRMVGRIEGIAMVERELKDLSSKLEDDD